VKSLSLSLVDGSSVVQAWETMGALDHLNVVTLYSHFVDVGDEVNPTFCAILELCEINLERCLNGNTKVVDMMDIKDQEKVSWCYQMLCAVEYLHSNNVIHSNLRPGLSFVVFFLPRLTSFLLFSLSWF
jgi:serine/threonine protein kinase